MTVYKFVGESLTFFSPLEDNELGKRFICPKSVTNYKPQIAQKIST